MRPLRTFMIIGVVFGWWIGPWTVRGEEEGSVMGLIRESEHETAASRHEEAQSLARRATEVDPAWGPAWRQYGLALLHGERAEEAVPAFRRALELEEGDATAQRGLALALWRTERPHEAVNALSAYLRLKPEDAVAWRDMATWMIRLGRAEQAISALKRVVDLKPEDAAAWREKGVLHLRQGQDEEAVPALERVLELTPEDGGTWRELGVVLLRMDRREAAAEALEAALRLRPEDPGVLRDLGWCLWTLGRREEAVAHLESAVNLGVGERDRIVLYVVARLAEEGEAEEAKAFYRRTEPDAPWSDVALELAGRGRVSASEPLLEAAWEEGAEPVGLIGLHLAYARVVNGRFEGIASTLGPFVEEAEAARGEHLDMALETLRLGSTEAGVPALISQLEEVIGDRRIFDERMTDLLEKAAEEQRLGGEGLQALDLYRRVLERDPNRTSWIWAHQLSAAHEPAQATVEWLTEIEARTTSAPVRAGIEGVRADLAGRSREAVERLAESVALEPHQPVLREVLFRNLLRLGRTAEAREEVRWFAGRVESGQDGLRSTLAEMFTRMGEYEEALAHWGFLHDQDPERVYYGVESGYALYRLGKAEEALELLGGMVERRADPQLYELMAEIEMARGHPAEVAALAEAGLAVQPTLGLLRMHAESNEVLGRIESALGSAEALLREDPGNTSMALLRGRALTALKRDDEAREHYRELLARNPFLYPARNALRDDAIRHGRFTEAVDLARMRTEIQPEDPEGRRLYAHALANENRFRPALRGLRRFAGRSPNDAVPVLVYRLTSEHLYEGKNSVDQISGHVAVLAEMGYHFIQTEEQRDALPGTRRVMILLLDPDARVVERLDPVLEAYDARVLYVANATLPVRGPPGMPVSDRLAPLLETGRWRAASSHPPDVRRLPVNASGVRGNGLIQPMWSEEGGRESAEAFAERVELGLAKAVQPLRGQGERLLVYPAGDFGQLSLDVGGATDGRSAGGGSEGFEPLDEQVAALNRLRDAVGRAFTHAVYFDESGFWLSEGDRLRIPARVVPVQWTAEDVMAHVTRRNPLVRAQLELGRVLSWHGQYEAAIRAYARAADMGADPAAVAFNWGLASHRQGDTPTAISRLEEAVELAPEDERVTEALELAEDRLRPTLRFFVRGWEDNEDRRMYQAGVQGDLHPGERWGVGLTLDRNRWETEGAGSEEGTRVGIRGKRYLEPQIWVSGHLWHLDMDDLSDNWGGEVDLRIPNPLVYGTLNAVVNKSEIETMEAVREGIDSRIFALRSYTRLVDSFDLFADLSRNNRTDGNTTDMLEGRLLYRLREAPYAGLGWRFRFADSDENPPEYWAPDELEQHQAHLNLRGDWERVKTTLSGEAGYARERETDWRFVWGIRGEGEVVVSPGWSLYGDLGWFEGPTYERLSGRAGLLGRF